MSSFAYALQPNEKIDRGFVRVLEQIAVKGRRLTRKPARPISVLIHESRILIKRVRALLWFARLVFHPSVYEEAKARLRSAAQLLATPRDLTVTQATLRKLARKTSAPRDQKALAQTSRILGRNPPGDKKSLHDSFRQAGEILLQAIEEIKKNAAINAGWPSPSDRLAKSFRVTRKTGKKALRSGKAAHFHAWRKKAKRLLYHLQFIHAKPDKRLARTIKQVDKLQDKLGTYHDCVVVQDRLRQQVSVSSGAQRTFTLLEKRKKQLRARVQKIAPRLHAK